MHELKGLDIKASIYKTLKLIRQRLGIELCCLFLLMFSAAVFAEPSQMPLSLTTAGKPNVLVILDNSNSMDEDPEGVAVGSNCKTSKSEIARYVIKGITNKPNYIGNINMGLMTYQLSATVDRYIYDSQYDVSYNFAKYQPVPSNAIASPLKNNYMINSSTSCASNSMPSQTSLCDFIYYNYRSPFYLNDKIDNVFCYSPNNSYRCFNKKTGNSDFIPTQPVPLC